MSSKEQRERDWRTEGRRGAQLGPIGRPAVQLRCFYCHKLLAEAVTPAGLKGLRIKCPRCKRVAMT